MRPTLSNLLHETARGHLALLLFHPVPTAHPLHLPGAHVRCRAALDLSFFFSFRSERKALPHNPWWPQSLVYIGLYVLFLLASEQHTKIASFFLMVAVALGATAALFWLTARR